MAENAPQDFNPYVLTHTFDHRHHVRARRVHFSPDGLFLAVVCDPAPRTYLLSPLELHRVYRGHAAPVTDVSFSSNSRFLAISSYDATIRIWDVLIGSLVGILTGHNSVVSCVKFNPGVLSHTIVSGSSDETIRIWDVDTGACNMVIAAFGGPVSGVDFHPDGSMIIACTLGGLCRIWNASTGARIHTIKETGVPSVGSVKFSPDGRLVLFGVTNDILRIWSMDSSSLLPVEYVGHRNTNHLIKSTFLGANDRYIMSGSEDNCICIWEIMSGRMVQKIAAHRAPVLSVSSCCSPNLIASASPEDDDVPVQLWSWKITQVPHALQSHLRRI